MPEFVPTQVIARQAIRYLKRGVFPPQNIDYYTVGRERELSLITKTMQKMPSNDCNHFFIEANYGYGKSHMLKAIESLALRNKFMVTSIVMNAYEHAFNHPPRYIHSLFENLKAPNLDVNGLWKLILYWSNNSERERLIKWATSSSIPNDVHAVINDLCNGMFVDYYLLDSYKRTIECRDLQIRGSVYYSLLFDKINVLESNAKALGFNGLVCLFDEVESIATLLPNVLARLRSYEILNTLCNAKKYPYTLFFFSITPDFNSMIPRDLEKSVANDYNRSQYRTNYLKGCQFMEKWKKKEFNILTLGKINKRHNLNLCHKLVSLHQVGYEWDASNRIGDDFISWFVDEAEKYSMPEREIIKLFISILEISQQYTRSGDNKLMPSALMHEGT